MISPSMIQRLAFIRYLYTLASEQSAQPEPLSSASVLTFHDSIELFLQMASEHLNVGSARPDFMGYWDLINPKLNPNQLAQKESIRRLNKSRVSLKHHGTLPSKLDIESFRSIVTSFFEENTPLVFGVQFQSVSLVNLVTCDSARESLDQASELLNQAMLDDAMDKIAVAFSQLLDDYETRKEGEFGRSPFFFGTSFSPFDFGTKITREDYQLNRTLKKMKENLTIMQSAIKILSLGLDYARYARFRLYTPSISRAADGSYHIFRSEKHQVSLEECRFAFDFVIAGALRLQQSDYTI
jgi:hypothetical protein